MTGIHKHRLESNRACLQGLATNLLALAHECPEEREDLIRAARHLERGLEVVDEVMHEMAAR